MYVSSLGGVLEEAATRLNEVSADEEQAYLNWFHLCMRDITISFPTAPFLYASADRTLSSGTRQYTHLPSNFERMILATIPGQDVKLKHLTDEEFAAIQPSATELGVPTVYTIHGASGNQLSQVEFYPTPGSGYTVNYQYRTQAPTMSAQSAVLPIPLKYSELPVLYIEFRGLRRREDQGQADSVEAKYEAMKNKMIEDFKRITEEPWRIKSIREFTPANRMYSDEVIDMFWNANR